MQIGFSRFLLKKSFIGNLGVTTRYQLAPLTQSRKLSQQQPYSNTSSHPTKVKITMSDQAQKEGGVNLHKDPYGHLFVHC
jgi:hypothetical protein